jgi:hypothetical protein
MGDTPWGAIAQAGVGLAQTIGGWVQQGKATKKFEKTLANAPKTTANKSILDFYNEALSRYNVNPQSSALYKRQSQNINRGVATGINSLQDRRSGQAGISSILRGSNDAYLDAEVAAENEKSNRFGQLGAATGMKSSDDQRVEELNVFEPHRNKLAMYGAKATGGANIMNAGISNVGNAANSYAQWQMLNSMYGNSANGGRNSRQNASARALAG